MAMAMKASISKERGGDEEYLTGADEQGRDGIRGPKVETPAVGNNCTAGAGRSPASLESRERGGRPRPPPAAPAAPPSRLHPVRMIMMMKMMTMGMMIRTLQRRERREERGERGERRETCSLSS